MRLGWCDEIIRRSGKSEAQENVRFISFDEVAERIAGRTVAIVGSGPSCINNEPGLVDSYDIVIRVNNYRTGTGQGARTDIYYSFFGGSIRKTAVELKADGVQMCWCKCPNAQPIESAWHERNNKQNGIDFRYVYDLRKNFWFCDTFIPTVDRFLMSFEALKKHIPSTGFSAIWDVITCRPQELFLTGFDFFQSRIHNVNEPWKAGNPEDPIGHRPDLEIDWLRRYWKTLPLTGDHRVMDVLGIIA